MTRSISRICVVLILALLLTGCAKAVQEYTVNGVRYTVDTENQTIYDGVYTYTYYIGNTGHWVVTYPDGTKVSAGNSFYYNDILDERYANFSVLKYVLEESDPRWDPNGGMIFAALLVLGIGVLNIAVPQWTWYIRHGIYCKDSEPTNFAISSIRISGVVVLIMGIFLMFRGCTGF